MKKDFRKITRKNSFEYFKCINCEKRFIEKKFYRTKNLVYLCEKCYKNLKKEMKNENI